MLGALIHAIIYTNKRKQFDKKILLFQGVGFTLTDFLAKNAALTHGILKFCENCDIKMKKYGFKLPEHISHAFIALGNQYKNNCALLSKKVCYDVAILMGRAG
jgi:hypothetical protein